MQADEAGDVAAPARARVPAVRRARLELLVAHSLAGGVAHQRGAGGGT